MKCPKSASGVLFEMLAKEVAQEAYQQRLDKVLSKFKRLDCIRLNWSNNFDIEYTSNKFYMVGVDYSDEYIFRQHISLETVESLLRDLSNE